MLSSASIRFANGVPDRRFPYHRCHRDAKDVALYRLVDAQRQRWALYNDDADHVIHVSAMFVLRQAKGNNSRQSLDGKDTQGVVTPSLSAQCGLRPLGETRLTAMAACGQEGSGASVTGAGGNDNLQASSVSASTRQGRLRGGIKGRLRATQPTARDSWDEEEEVLTLCATVTVAPLATEPFIEYDNASDVASATMHLHVSARSETRAEVTFLGGVRVEDGTVVRGPDVAMLPEGRFRKVYRCFRGHDNGLLFRLVDEDASGARGTCEGDATRIKEGQIGYRDGASLKRVAVTEAAAELPQTWAFFNDTTSYSMHIRMRMFGLAGDVVALGETVLRHEYGSSASSSRSASSAALPLVQQQVLSAAEEGRWFHARKQKSVDAGPFGPSSEAEDTPEVALFARTASQDDDAGCSAPGNVSAASGGRSVVLELTVPPLATRLFLRGRPSNFALDFSAEPVGNEVPEYDRVHFYRGGPDTAVIDYDQLYVCLRKDADGLLYRLVDRGAGERWAFYNDTATLTFVVTCHFHLPRAWLRAAGTRSDARAEEPVRSLVRDAHHHDSDDTSALKAALMRRIAPGPETVVLAMPRLTQHAVSPLHHRGDVNRIAHAAAAKKKTALNGDDDWDISAAQAGHRLTVRKVRHQPTAALRSASIDHKENCADAASHPGTDSEADPLYILSLHVPPGQTRLFMCGDVPERYELYYEARNAVQEGNDSHSGSENRRSTGALAAQGETTRRAERTNVVATDDHDTPHSDVDEARRRGARTLPSREAFTEDATLVTAHNARVRSEAAVARNTTTSGDEDTEEPVSAAEVNFLAGGPDRGRFDYATVYRCFATVGNGLAFRLVNATNDAWGFYNDMRDVELVVVAKFMNERDIFCNDLGPAVRACVSGSVTRLFRVRHAQDVVIERWQRPVLSASSSLLPPASTSNEGDERQQRQLSRSSLVAGRMHDTGATMWDSASELKPLRSKSSASHSHASSRVRRLSRHARTVRPVTAGLGLQADSSPRQRSSASSDSAPKSENSRRDETNDTLSSAAVELERVSACRVSHSVPTYYTMATLVVGPGETRPFVRAIRRGTMSPYLLHLRTRRAPDRDVRFMHDAALHRSTHALGFRVDEVFRCFADRDPGMLFRLAQCVDPAQHLPQCVAPSAPSNGDDDDDDALAVVPLIDESDEWKFRCEQIDWAYYNDTTDLCFLVTMRFDARSALETLGHTIRHRQRRTGPSFSRAGLHTVTASAHSPFLRAPDTVAIPGTPQPASTGEAAAVVAPLHPPHSDLAPTAAVSAASLASDCAPCDALSDYPSSPGREEGYEVVCRVVVWPLQTERLVRGSLVGTYSSSIRSDAAPENDKIVFRNAQPRVPGGAAGSLWHAQGSDGRRGASYTARLYRVFPRTENGLLFRIVDDVTRQWYFYNDSTAYAFTVRVHFVNSTVTLLGATKDVTRREENNNCHGVHNEAGRQSSQLSDSSNTSSTTDDGSSGRVCVVEANVAPLETVAFVHAIDVVHFQVHASVTEVVGKTDRELRR